MKKNVLRKDFFMEIRKTMGRFVSIFFIVALGVAFYSGIRASEPSMRISGDSYFDKSNLMDIKVMGSMGLTDDDIRAINELEGIEETEGAYSKDVLCPVGDTDKVVHVISVQNTFNTVAVKEGRLPEKEGECLLDEDFLAYADYKVGDQIIFRSGDETPLTDSMVTDTYTVVGIGNSPLYISFGRGSSMIGTGEVSGFVMVDEASFDMDVYTEAYVRVRDTLDETAFTEEYDKLSDAAVEALEQIKEERCMARRDEILEEANKEIADAEETVNEESGKLDDAKKELEEAKSTAARELSAARKKLADGEAKLAKSQKQIADGEAQLASARTELNAQQKKVTAARQEYEEGVAQLNAKEKELLEGEKQYQEEYEKNMPLIQEKKEEIEAAKPQLEEGLEQIEAGLTEILSGLDALSQLQAGISQAQTEIQQTETEIADGDARYSQYEMIPEDERTEEQKRFLTTWKAQKALLRLKATMYQAEIDRALSEAGFASVDEMNAQIDSLQKSRQELEDSQSELLAQQAELEEGERLLLESEQKLEETAKVIEDGKRQIADGKKTLATAKQQIDSGQAQIDAAWALLEKEENTLVSGKSELEEGQKELAEGRAEYEQAAAEAAEKIADGETQIADGEEELIEARQEIADAKAEIEKIENPKWYIQSRGDALTEYNGYGENADRMRSLGQVFPVLFFLVAALISLTTMTRMVEEQRVQIGTLKALGYGKFAIAKKYLYYALAATLGGSVFGALFGEKIFPFIIIYAYKIMYKHIPDILVPYHLSYALQATVIAVFCTSFATIASCYKELASQPAQLMRPPAPKQGKRILLERAGWFWKRLSFIWKSSIRNLVRYKKRFFMTIFGIGGCMALMLVGFGLKDCIYEIVELQYEKVQFYDASVYFEDKASKEEKEEILDYLSGNSAVEGAIPVRMQKVDLKAGKEKRSVYLTVPNDETEIEDFLSFHSRIGDEVYSLKEDQVILTEKASQLLKVEAGDTLTISDEDRGDREVVIGAVCENYLGGYLYLSNEAYEELYGAPPRYNSILYMVKAGEEKEIEEIGTTLLSHDQVLNVSYTSSIESRLDDMLKSLNLVIVVLIISAGLLAFVVLYNLNNINITERRRELATLKVLGFYDMEVASYVYRENVLLTIIGAVLGMGLGNLLHRYVIVTVEVEEAMFGRTIHWPSYLYSFLFTVAFSVFVNLIMFYKLRKIDMVESLKSVE
ncbi:FtsX-like permease family protein [Roseburia hominis]